MADDKARGTEARECLGEVLVLSERVAERLTAVPRGARCGEDGCVLQLGEGDRLAGGAGGRKRFGPLAEVIGPGLRVRRLQALPRLEVCAESGTQCRVRAVEAKFRDERRQEIG